MRELGELPASWRWATIGEVARVVGGSTPRTSDPSFWGGDISWITPNDLSGYTSKFIGRGRRTITKAGYESCSTQMVPAGTVLFTSRAPIGYVAIADQALCTNQGFKSLVCGPEVRAEYLYWYLQSARGLIEGMASGTTFKEISGRTAATIPVAIPPLDEQDRLVASIERQLTRLDSGRAAIGRSRQRLHRYRMAVMDAAVWGRVGDGRTPAFAADDPEDLPRAGPGLQSVSLRLESSTEHQKRLVAIR